MPLYEVKNKLSECVALCERGETISITKHGKRVAVLVGADEYERMENRGRKPFMEALEEWRARWEADESEIDDTTPWDNIRSKEIYEPKNIWDE